MSPFLVFITYTWDDATQTLHGDLSAVTTELENRIAADPVTGKVDLSEFARTIKAYQAESMTDFPSFRNTFAAQGEEYAWLIDSAGKNIIQGTSGNDFLSGTVIGDAFNGGDGNDNINAGSLVFYDGPDVLYGGAGCWHDSEKLLEGKRLNWHMERMAA